MSSTGIEPKHGDVDIQALKEKDTLHSEILVDKNLMTNAFEGENQEHKETVWEAVKTHKMACLWAFVSSPNIHLLTRSPLESPILPHRNTV